MRIPQLLGVANEASAQLLPSFLDRRPTSTSKLRRHDGALRDGAVRVPRDNAFRQGWGEVTFGLGL